MTTSTMAGAPEVERQAAVLAGGVAHDPHGFLGMHTAEARDGHSGPTVRVWAPGVDGVALIETGGRRPRHALERLHPAGLFGVSFPKRRKPFPYRLQVERHGGVRELDDPYRFPPTLGPEDLHYIGEGTHRRLYDVLGAHPRTLDGVEGVSFAVWAPGARGASVTGDFNGWNRRSHPMRVLGGSGVWELFIPGLGVGQRYKYAIRGADWVEQEKADPLAFASELRPKTASIVADLHAHEWGDEEWMRARRGRDPFHEPMSVYEVHLGSWRRHPDGSWLTYRELGDELIPYVREMGFTHIELLPIEEHPYDGSWGYQVTGFYAPTSRYGTPREFQEFVDRCHQAGVGVLLDWVPAHFAVDAHALARFDGTYLYEHADVRRRYQPDWGTFLFNYARHEVRNFLTANALYWLREHHIDGLRVDGVSSMLYLDYSRQPGEWTPNRFGGREHLEAIALLQEANELVRVEGEGAVTIAEESTAWPGVSRPTSAGGLGFDFKWNMGWMHDTLDYFSMDPIHRKFHHGLLTFGLMYAYNENFILALSHDEVVHLKRSLLHKMPGDEWQMFANLRLLHAYQHGQPGKKLIFMGGEFGQRGEWNHDAALEWLALGYPPHERVRRLVAELNRLHREEPALHERDHEPEGFAWLDLADAENSLISWARYARDPKDHLVCAFNFTPVPRVGRRIPVPEAATYREVLNTDAVEWGGSGLVNPRPIEAEEREHSGHPHSLSLVLPPLGAVFLKPDRTPPPEPEGDADAGRAPAPDPPAPPRG